MGGSLVRVSRKTELRGEERLRRRSRGASQRSGFTTPPTLSPSAPNSSASRSATLRWRTDGSKPSREALRPMAKIGHGSCVCPIVCRVGSDRDAAPRPKQPDGGQYEINDKELGRCGAGRGRAWNGCGEGADGRARHDQPAGAVLQSDQRRRQAGGGQGGREARHLQRQQQRRGAEQRDRGLYRPEGRRHRAHRHRREWGEARRHGGEEGRHSRRRDRRPHPRWRQCGFHRRRQQRRGRGDRQILRRLREEQDGRLGQGRHRRRAQFLHPEPAPGRLQGGGPDGSRASSSSIRSTARTSRTSR